MVPEIQAICSFFLSVSILSQVPVVWESAVTLSELQLVPCDSVSSLMDVECPILYVRYRLR